MNENEGLNRLKNLITLVFFSALAYSLAMSAEMVNWEAIVR